MNTPTPTPTPTLADADALFAALAAVAPYASTDKSRPILCAATLQRDTGDPASFTAVATCTRTLGVASVSLAPALAELLPAELFFPDPVAAVKGWAKWRKGLGRNVDVSTPISVGLAGSSTSLWFDAPTLPAPPAPHLVPVVLPAMLGDFPNWRSLFPSRFEFPQPPNDGPAAMPFLNVNFLKRFSESASLVAAASGRTASKGNDEINRVRLVHAPDPLKPTVWEQRYSSAAISHSWALVMPVRDTTTALRTLPNLIHPSIQRN